MRLHRLRRRRDAVPAQCRQNGRVLALRHGEPPRVERPQRIGPDQLRLSQKPLMPVRQQRVRRQPGQQRVKIVVVPQRLAQIDRAALAASLRVLRGAVFQPSRNARSIAPSRAPTLIACVSTIMRASYNSPISRAVKRRTAEPRRASTSMRPSACSMARASLTGVGLIASDCPSSSGSNLWPCGSSPRTIRSRSSW